MAPSHSGLAFTQTTLLSSFIQRGSSSNSTTSTPGDTHRISKKLPPAKSKRQSKSVAAAASERVLTDVLLSIKPVHLTNIARRQKNHGYRKYRLHDGVTRLWFYETSEGGQGRASITHIAVISPSVRHTPGSVPTEPFGIDNTEFNAGLKQFKYRYPILELYELIRPVTLAEMKSQWNLGSAPMGWRYMTADLWENRWGGDQERAKKVKQVF